MNGKDYHMDPLTKLIFLYAALAIARFGTPAQKRVLSKALTGKEPEFDGRGTA